MSGIKTFVSVSVFAALLLAAMPGRPQSAAASQSSSPAQTDSSAQPKANSQPAQGASQAPSQGNDTSASPAAAGQAQPAPTTAPVAVLDPPTVAWKMLTDAVHSDKYPTRSDAIAALSVLDTDRRAVRLMIDALNDKEAIIRVQAATSLGQIKARAAIPALHDRLEDEEPQVVFAAAQALWNMGDRTGREILYEVLDNERKAHPGLIKGNIAKAKAEMHDPKGLILIGINSTSLALLGPGALGVTAVEEMATNHDAPLQALCAKMLADDDEPETVSELESALSDKSGIVRAAAAHALGSLNDPKAIPSLTATMQNDKSQIARLTAAAAIVRVSQRQRRKTAPSAQGKPQQASPSQPAQTPPQPTK
jgi:HEAT repeat protein